MFTSLQLPNISTLLQLLTYYFNSVLLMTSAKHHSGYNIYNCQSIVFYFYPLVCMDGHT